ncbi:MAG: FKBP-type peptidyl-prolyl cis-trans isomerase [Deltaproteobacteria bacterium]|nr:FKBP-type peptidyl-prolyl cis-trans isomerase [Deltaproteobacteria bacterium]
MDSIQNHKRVTLRYTLRTGLSDGDSADRPEERLSFVYGVERQAPSLEKAIEGRKTGDRLSVSIPASEVYGEHDPKLVVEIPRKGLIKQRLKQGQFYRQIRKGSLLSFKVLEIRNETVLADFNKPLAGIGASMDLQIVDVRDASGAEVRAAEEAERRRQIGCG